jgi:hypothetical protein
LHRPNNTAGREGTRVQAPRTMPVFLAVLLDGHCRDRGEFMRYGPLVTLSAVLVFAGCAGGGAGGASGTAPPTRRTNVITADEIASKAFKSAGEAVLVLRPHWDRSQNPSGGTELYQMTVYVNDRIFGMFATMNDIPADQVQEIRMVMRDEARVRWGPNAQQAIAVTLKKK